MKKLILALFSVFILLSGCEKDYDTVINPSTTGYFLEIVTEQDSLDFGLGDSTLFLQVKAFPVQAVNDVKANIKNPFGVTLNSLTLSDNGNTANADSAAGDSIYSNIFYLSDENPSGQYSVSYIVNGKQAAVQFTFFENGKEKFAPEISNLSFVDSITYSDTLIFSVLVVDSNGYEDIRRVFYEVFRPDGSQIFNSQGIFEFPMVDNGDRTQAGDEVAGDSVYTQLLVFPPNQPTVPPGQYRFEITAEDRSRRLSNTIIHYLEVH